VSEEKLKEELQDETEVVVNDENGPGNPEEDVETER